MRTSRLLGRRGDGSAAVRGWVAIYTAGLPAAIRDRRAGEVTGDLADERLDAVRHGTQGALFRQRLVRLLSGIPADLSWRLVDAPAMARDLSLPTDWVPPNRWSLALLGMVAVGTAGALGIVTLPYLSGQIRAEVWPGWGRYGFTLSSIAVLVGIVLAVPWPHLGLRLVLAGVVVGFLSAPWLWGCWFLALIAVVVRRHLAGGPRSDDRR